MEPLLVRSQEFGVRSTKLPTPNTQLTAKPWALTGCRGRKPNVIRSLYLAEGVLEKLNLALQKKYKTIQKEEERYEGINLSDAKIILVAYGTMARIAKSVMGKLREKGKKIGLIRPITLWPFPKNAFTQDLTPNTKYLVIEMSHGQMLEDVKLTVNGKAKVEFLGRAGGGIPTEEEIIEKIRLLGD